MFLQHLLNSSHYSKCSTNINSFNSHVNPMSRYDYHLYSHLADDETDIRDTK